jgi:hypothetical protein
MTTNHSFNRLDDRLDQALARLAVGAPLEVILAEAGNDAEQLRPLLEIAAEVTNLKSAVPIPPPEASLQKLLAHGEKLAHSTSLPAATRPGWLASLLNIFNGGFRLAAGLATAVLLFLVMSGTVYVVAQRSLPGDSLYRLKQVSERVQLNLAGDSLRREQLSQTFNQRRRAEIEALLNQGKSAEVTFESQIQTVHATAIVLDGLTIQLRPETKVVGQLSEGARVRVEIRTLPPNSLLALTITVIEPGLPPTPSPTATATPPKAQATDTLPPTATPPKAQATDSIILPPTPSPTPTARPTEPPLLTGDNLNDNSRADDFNQNGEDNFNDNADENADFDDDNFNDNSDEFDDDDRDSNSNDNSRDDNDNNDDRSGRGGGSKDDSDDNGDDSDDDDNSDDDDDSNDDDD